MTLPVRRQGGNDLDVGRPTWDPFTELSRIQRQLAELLDHPWTSGIEGGFVPPADVEETDDAFVVEIELPGVERKDIEVELAGRRLTVHGERKERERVGVLRRRTRSVGRFHYEVTLPADVSEDSVDARFSDGILTVKLAKTASAVRRRITVT